MIDASLRATVLGNLRQLNEEFGISVVYITHDLTTAYQISENIIVMYSGSVAEAGDIDLVVKQPQHPLYATVDRFGAAARPGPSLEYGSGDRIIVYRRGWKRLLQICCALPARHAEMCRGDAAPVPDGPASPRGLLSARRVPCARGRRDGLGFCRAQPELRICLLKPALPPRVSRPDSYSSSYQPEPKNRSSWRTTQACLRASSPVSGFGAR